MTSPSSNTDRGHRVFAWLLAVLLSVTPITLYRPEQVAHRTKRWEARSHGH